MHVFGQEEIRPAATLGLMPPLDGAVRCLVEAALADADPDGPVRWQVIAELRRRADVESFIEARRLCASDRVEERLLGVDILGMLRPFVDRSVRSAFAKFARARSVVVLIHARPPSHPLTSGGARRTCPIAAMSPMTRR